MSKRQSREIAHREIAGTTIEPYDGDFSDIIPGGFQSFEHHDWAVVRPPEAGKIQQHWSKLVTPVRALAIGILWLTLYWWRVAIAVSIVATIIILWGMS